MKIICDCGALSEFEIDTNREIDEENGQYTHLRGDVDIHAEHDQAWINCHKCKKAIWIFT